MTKITVNSRVTNYESGEFESVFVVTLKVNGGKVMELLRPQVNVLSAQFLGH